MNIQLQQITKENEELRAYIQVLKTALDNKAYQIGLGSQQVCLSLLSCFDCLHTFLLIFRAKYSQI